MATQVVEEGDEDLANHFLGDTLNHAERFELFDVQEGCLFILQCLFDMKPTSPAGSW